MDSSKKPKWLKTGLLALAVLLVVVAIYTILSSSSDTQKRLLHVSIRPVEAVPIKVESSGKIIGTFLEPEFDIEIDEDTEFLKFTVLGYETSDEIRPEFPNMTVTLKKKSVLSTEEEFDSTISTSKVFDLDNGYVIKNYKVYGNGRWVVGNLTTTGSASDGEIIVIERKQEENITLSSGTNIDTDNLLSAGVPQTIIDEMIRGAYEN